MVDGQRPFLLSLRPRPNTGRAPGSRSSRWSDVYGTLIRAGYGDPERIGKLTQRQILLLYETEQRLRRKDRAEALIDMNQAFAGGDAAEKHLKQLTK
ncbi:hypothetical protein DBR00_06820 [Pseudomonas sp. HMWF032]|nr:hypothetical protein DBR00_06820 [Pseudomonas sp. HMWF032]PTT85858.1 hypothetical protein DBR41_02415 [Pseudomonas sp. HMWF010]